MDIFVAFDVSKSLRSRLGRLLQPENILDIFVTFDVSKLPRSKLVKLLHP